MVHASAIPWVWARLLAKLYESMSKQGCLQVGKVKGKSGNFVYMNAKAVGLSNRLPEFEELGVRMAHYGGTLAKLTTKLSAKHIAKKDQKIYVPAPEWQGN